MESIVEKLRLKDIDKSTWKKYRFDQIAKNISERVEPSTTDLEIYVGLEHIGSESIHIKRYGKREDVNGTKLRCYPGDVIFGRRRAYQRKAAIADFDGFCSAHSLVLRANSDVVNPKLFPFFLHSDTFMHRAVDISVGSLSPTINWGELKKQEFLLPPIDQQEQIAELLWYGDSLLQKYYSSLTAMNQLRLAIRRNIVCDSQYLRKPLSEVLTRITAGKSFNGRNNPPVEGEKGVLKVSAVGADGFEPLESKVLNNQSEFLPKFIVHKNDLLITRANTTELVGRVCLVDEEYPNLMLCDKTLRLEVDESSVSKLFLLEALLSSEIRNQIEDRATGTGGAMKNISQSEIRSLKVPLPDYSVQKNIEKKLQKIKIEQIDLKGNIKLFSNLQKSLINQNF